jgi:hypothetical protein
MRRSWLPVLLGLLAACAAGGASRGSGSGELVVQVYSGFTSSAPALAPAPAHLIVDVSGMLEPGAAAAADEQRRLAQSLIVPYLARHPGIGLESAAVHVFRRTAAAPGDASGASCSDPSSGASLAAAQALGRLEQELAEREAARNARVVLFSTFESECVPQLCEAAARLVERGAWLDVVAIQSDARVPACLASLRPAPQAPIPWLASWSAAKPASFRVETVAAPGAEPRVLAEGTAETPLRLEVGLHRIRIALDPPEIIGPIQVRSDQRLRIRVLDFPLSAPGERTWTVDVDDRPR